MALKPLSRTGLTLNGSAQALSGVLSSTDSNFCRAVTLYNDDGAFHFGGVDLTTANGMPVAATTLHEYVAHQAREGEDAQIDLREVYVIGTSGHTLRVMPQV